MMKRIYITNVTYSQAKAAAQKAGITLKEWLGRAVIAYASQEDEELNEQFARLYNALDGFSRGASRADGGQDTDE